jgi:hypothetical protein
MAWMTSCPRLNRLYLLREKMAIKHNFTEKELLEELAGLLDNIVENISSFISVEAGRAVLGLPASQEPLPKVEISMLDGLPITDAMRRAYDYVMNARFPIGNDISEPLEDVALFMEFFGHRKTSDSYCRYIHDAAFARRSIDEPWEGTNLTFEEISLLAKVDERTVRNAASDKGDKPLQIIKEGGRTVVSPENALDWLKTRPGFKQTVFYTENDYRSFSSITEFGQFLSKSREERGLDHEQFLEKIGWQKDRLDELKGIEQGLVKCNIEDILPLARALGEQEPRLLCRFMEVFYPTEWRVIKTYNN